MKMISVVTPCYNEEENVRDVYEQVKMVFEELNGYTYEHIFIDNASQDATVAILKEIARNDKRVRIIVNTRNFGHMRSPYHGLLQTRGDAVVSLVADLQDPPHLIKDFIRKWEEGYKVVIGVKRRSEESPIMFRLRGLFYRTLRKLADIDLVEQYTGFGLYDRRVVEILRSLNDPYPYFRGLIVEIGFEIAKIEYTQPKRKRGITKANFYILYDLAMLGLTNYSKAPLRLATMFGFVSAAVSLFVAFFYLVNKLLFWNRFAIGMAGVIIGMFFMSGVLLFCIGILGEYLGSVHTQVLRRPLVIERERINFDHDDALLQTNTYRHGRGFASLARSASGGRK